MNQIRNKIVKSYQEEGSKDVLFGNIEERKRKEQMVDVEPIHTDEIMLPYASNEHLHFKEPTNCQNIVRITKTTSKSGHTSPQRNMPNFLKSSQAQQAFTRQNISQMSRRHRNIRSHQYRRKDKNSDGQGNKEQLWLDEKAVLSGREVKLSEDKLLTRNMIASSFGQRIMHNFIRNSDYIEEGKRASSTHQLSRQQSPKIENSSKGKISQQVRFNPLVIYPFESKLKAKKIEDNPKVLSNIIKKKCKEMEKDDLYLFLNGLIRKTSK